MRKYDSNGCTIYCDGCGKELEEGITLIANDITYLFCDYHCLMIFIRGELEI